MPFKIEMIVPIPESKPSHIPIMEANELQAIITKLTKENEELHQKNCKAATNKDELKYHLGKETKNLVGAKGALLRKEERNRRFWMV